LELTICFSFFVRNAERRELEDKQNEENNQIKEEQDEISDSDNDSATSDNEDSALYVHLFNCFH
jgi:hypothetical protein